MKPGGVPSPRSERGRKAIRAAQLAAARDRRVGQLMRLENAAEDGTLTEAITDFLTEARTDWNEGRELTREQVGFLNRLTALLSEE